MDYCKQLDVFLSNKFPTLQLKSPLFYSAAIAIRFELGGSLKGKTRVERVVHRAHSIFCEINQPSDHVFLVIFVDDLDKNTVCSLQNDVYQIYSSYVSGVKNEEIDRSELEFRYKDPDNDGLITYRYCIKFKMKDLNTEELLRAFAYREIEYYEPHLIGDIFLVNETRKTICHIYDDRGMDVVAVEKETLRLVYNKYNNWILDYDRSQINQIFLDSTSS
jgi:hypothetical protein